MKISLFFKIATVAAILTCVVWGRPVHTTEVHAQDQQDPTVECFVFEENLSRGQKGESVANLQRWLIREGFDIPSLHNGVKYGVFGVQTQQALKEYQKSLGMTKGLGFFGPVTRTKIAAQCAATPKGPEMLSQKVSTVTEAPVSVRLVVNGKEKVKVSPKANLSFTWESEGATYCYNSSQQEKWDLWKGKQIRGSAVIAAPSQVGNYVYSITCGTSVNLHEFATSTVSVDVN